MTAPVVDEARLRHVADLAADWVMSADGVFRAVPGRADELPAPVRTGP